MSTQVERFVDHLLNLDPRNTYDAASHRARVYMQPGMDASALFVLEPEGVTARLEKLETDVGSLWPDAPLDVRTYWLLSIHLAEFIRYDPEEVFTVTASGIHPVAE